MLHYPGTPIDSLIIDQRIKITINFKRLKRRFGFSFPTVPQDTKGLIYNCDSLSKVNILVYKYKI